MTQKEKSKGPNKTRIVKFRMSEDDFEKLQMLSDYQNFAMSTCIRKLIIDQFDKNKTEILKKAIFS